MITVWPSIYKPAEGRRVSFAALLERVKAPHSYARKSDVGRWSPGVFEKNYRNRASFVAAGALVTDVGDYAGGVQRAEVERAFAGLLGFAYTSWSSMPSAPRWRVALFLSRPISADEHDRAIRFVFMREERTGIAPDYASKDAPHAWALPARHEGDAYECFDLDGEPLDVAKALEIFPKPEPESLPDRESAPYDRRVERASRYLATMPGAISGSGGHAATFAAAVKLARGFRLDVDDVLRLLVDEFNARCSPPWTLVELRHKARQAVQRGRLPAGFLADRSVRGRV